MIKCKNECPLNKVEGVCCVECPHAEGCPERCELAPESCEDAVFEGTELEVFKGKAVAVIEKISLLVKQKKEIEAAETEMKEQLQKAMEIHGIKKFDNEVIKIAYVEATKHESIDGAKLKMQMPEIAAKFTKMSNVKAYVKIELKGDK